MKRVFCVILAALLIGALLQGCSGGTGFGASSSPEALSSAAARGGEAKVTREMAYQGVAGYCRSVYGSVADESGSIAELEMGQGTESEYLVVFRGYTGAIVNFYVEKESGATRMVEHVPALGIENEAGTFDLFDYLGAEGTAAPTGGTASPEPAEATPTPQSSFVFKPKVCSSYMEEVFGKTMCDAWYNLVDAVMAGEDSFACPNQNVYDWVMGQFPKHCFPAFSVLIDLAEDRENSVIDGVASFTYRVPREEAAKLIEESSEIVEGILNETMKPEHSDFEKALALYDYFSKTYKYDYDAAERMNETYVDDLTPYRVFTTGTGICSELAPAYSYLLMQAGVDATTMQGGDHEWSYVRINGRDYHVDPTFVLSDPGSLAYFLMTDEQRAATGYSREDSFITSHYSKDNPHPEHNADDDTFAPLWDRTLEKLSPDENKLRCWRYTVGWEKEYLEFDYTGY